MILEINSMLDENLAVPLSHLIQAFSTKNKNSAKLTFSFSGNMLQRLEEIMNSEDFHKYSVAHTDMRNGNVKIESAIRKISETRDRLVSSFKELRKNSLAFYLLEQSSVIAIKSTIGNLPSSIATAFFGMLKKIAPIDRRIIIFSLENLMDDNMLQLFRKDVLEKTGVDLALHIKNYFSS